MDKDYPTLPMLSGRYNEIGEKAADFFLKQHYSSLAFIGYEGILWSEQRWDGFVRACNGKGVDVHPLFVSDAMKQRETIEQWLKNLPKPIAVFACHDAIAVTLSEICQFMNISVPDEVAILGADNDVFLCNISYPRISSINLDFEKQGYCLCETIFQMIDEGRMWPVRIPIEPSEVVERESTIRHRTSDKSVLSALKYMDEHYVEPIGVEDVVRTIPLSRRALEIRFTREMSPLTLKSYLNKLRVEHMCRLLKNTECSIGAAAESAGFSDPSNVGRIFRKVTGMSPKMYRSTQKSSWEKSQNS